MHGIDNGCLLLLLVNGQLLKFRCLNKNDNFFTFNPNNYITILQIYMLCFQTIITLHKKCNLVETPIQNLLFSTYT